MQNKQTNLLQRYVPILEWLPRYNRAWLTGDVIAGLSVWALTVPASLGSAVISGVPVQYGLYAATIASLLYPLFASSRHVITGPAAPLAAITGAAVLAVTSRGSPEAIQLVAAISVLAGILYILFALLKMGWISNFLSESVLTGYVFGIGIVLVVSQLHRVTGTIENGANTWEMIANWIRGLPETDLATLAVGLIALVLLFALKRYAPKVPGSLLVVGLAIGVELILGLSNYGVELVGSVPRGLPGYAVPNVGLVLQNLHVVIPAAIGVFLVSFSVSLAAARQFASEHHYDIEVDQEMQAQGMANAVSGLFQSLSSYGVFSRTSVSVASGSKTELASIIMGVLLILTLLFLAPLFSHVPLAVLGAVIIEAVVLGLWKVSQMQRLYQLARTEFWLALAALLGVLTFGLLNGVLIGVTLSLLWLVWHSSHPAIPVLGRMPNSKVYHNIERHPESETEPGLVIIRFDGPLFFATATSLRERIRELTTDVVPAIKTVILDMESTSIIDLEGVDALHRVVKELNANNVDFHLVRTKEEILEVLEQDGVLDTLGRDSLFDHVHEAVEVACARNTDRQNNLS
ncbi:MAG: SulP family inorganic anion transporter [Chloroflexi bacterium]|nr:SulP family inorganic anion transporter [Chloroflexota bacterium]